ncbi:MAG: PAS domain S-box protein [Chitinophagales bacterium]
MGKADHEMNMFDLFEMTPDLVCIAGKDGFFRKVNPAVIEKFGYTEKELFERPISSFIHPGDKAQTSQKRSKLLQGSALLNFENRYLTKKGEIIWLEWTSIYSSDKEIVFAIAKDITGRKQIEKEVEQRYKKFKSLTTHFKSSIEEDRKYLAVELHEELAQLASVVKMDLDWLSTYLTDLSGSSKKRIEHGLAISKLLIKALRRISFLISPNMLDDLGLNATLKWLCKEFSILNGIPCLFEGGFEEKELTHEIKIDLFRICQDALINVMYHAKAQGVEVRAEQDKGKVSLVITDDGAVDDMKKPARGRGLTGMQERADSINGKLNITKEPGIGTTVCFSIEKH